MTNNYLFNKYFFIIILFVFFVSYKINSIVNNKFRTYNITKVLNNSKFAGYAIFINKRQLLTTYDLVNNICKNSNIYILNDNDYYRVYSVLNDLEYGLSLLEVSTKKRTNFKNYTLISKENLNKLLVVNNINDPFNFFLKKKSFKNVNNYLYSGSYDVFSQRQGGPIFDNNLGLYGLIIGNSKNSIFNIFSNNILAVNGEYLINFFKKNNIEYKTNESKVNLNLIKDYKNKVTAKIICVPIVERLPKSIILQ